MSVAERILLLLSRPADERDYSSGVAEHNQDDALSLLKRVYPNFGSIVSGKRVVDFGCGDGNQAIALVREYDCSVVGIDSNTATLARAEENMIKHDVPSRRLSFVEAVSPEMRGTFDVVISQNSFEHFPDPQAVLHQMGSLLNSSGLLLITFGPPWFAPYGSHMHFFCKVPWINVIFPEKAVMRARSQFRNDGATTYEEVESGLNKMTMGKFESLISSCNLKITHRKYECVKGINWLSKIPLVRELFINHVTVILSKAA